MWVWFLALSGGCGAVRQLIIILRPGPAQCSSCSCRVLVPRGFGPTGLHSVEISVVFFSFFKKTWRFQQVITTLLFSSSIFGSTKFGDPLEEKLYLGKKMLYLFCVYFSLLVYRLSFLIKFWLVFFNTLFFSLF